MWFLELLICLGATEDDEDNDAVVKEEIVDAAADDDNTEVVGDLISSSLFFSGLENNDETHFLFIFSSIFMIELDCWWCAVNFYGQ